MKKTLLIQEMVNSYQLIYLKYSPQKKTFNKPDVSKIYTFFDKYYGKTKKREIIECIFNKMSDKLLTSRKYNEFLHFNIK